MNAAQISIVLVGILVPAAFAVFVALVTRTGGDSEARRRLAADIDRLRDELHEAYAAHSRQGAAEP